MEKQGTTIKRFLLAIILLVLLLPLVQQHLQLYESEALEGYAVPAEKRWFSFNGWWSGLYQEAYEKWYGENFGFRPELVRLYNQIAYELYNEAKANGVIIGKEEYLYELNYIKAYNGEDFIGMQLMLENARKLKALQDSLEAKGKTLIVCLAPGKASFYPEYIPDEYGKGSDSTSYKIFAQLLRGNNINHIDYNKWFIEMKGKTPYVLYPKSGIHWSRYGSTLAIDSLIKYVEHKRNVDMPSVIWERTLLSDSLRSPDDDIARAMNLFCPPKPLSMGYPQYHFEDTSGKAKLKMMAFGDSFFWSIMDVGLAPRSFTDIAFYYYNEQVYRSNHDPMMPADLAICMKDADSSDVIILIATECTIWRIGWGFIDEGYNYFVEHRTMESDVRLIAKWEAVIRADEKWMNDILKKADDQGKTLDEMIYLDAKFMAEEELKANQK